MVGAARLEYCVAQRLPWAPSARCPPFALGVPYSGADSPLAGATAELGGNAVEYAGQLRAQAIHYSDDRYRDASRDQAVFNGGRAAVVTHETQN